MGCQKGVTQEWLGILILSFQGMIRKMINWPKRQYLHTTTTTITAASTATTSAVATTTTITKTATSLASTAKAEDIEKNYLRNHWGKSWTKLKHDMCI